jgi:hypothetical protein
MSAPGDISTRSVKAANQTKLLRIGANREDNGYRRGCAFCGKCWLAIANSYDQRDAAAHEVGGQSRQAIVLVVGPPEFKCNIPAFDIPGISQALADHEQTILECLR